MKKLLKNISLILSLISLVELPVQAINITYSDKTKKNSIIFGFKGGTNLPFNLGVNGGFDFYPQYSNMIGSLSDDERWSLLGTGELNLLYNWNLAEIKTIAGDFNPTLSPFIGYKHYFAHTGIGGLSFSQIEPSSIFSNAGGVNYGLRFSSNLPLGFYVYAEGGATSLLNGSWTQSKPDKSGIVSGGGLLLPNASIGASLNVFNIASLRAGYNLRYIPDIRNPNATLNDASKSLIHSFEVGLSFLFFSI